jgi:4-alpha-glucanotransferase
MGPVRFILAIHNHQPVGTAESDFEQAYQTSYSPLLDVLAHYPEIPFALHTSGPLLEWLADSHPGFINLVRALVQAGRIEILGGGFFEPILPMIPHRDRVGQIRSFTAYLEEIFSARVRGLWLAGDVWEQELIAAICEAGIEYAVLGDAHFRHAGYGSDLCGHYLTENDGHLLKVFPASHLLRVSLPLPEPVAIVELLHNLAERHPGATVVFAGEGATFSAPPSNINEHISTKRWLARFCDLARANRSWLVPMTFARVVDTTLPLGKLYLPGGWSARPSDAPSVPETPRALVQSAGRSWRNVLANDPASDEMYARMLGLSRRLADLENDPQSDPDYLEVARKELYRSQCNDAYWRGPMVGLDSPHLRHAVFGALIAAHGALDDALGRVGPRVALEIGDFNLDLRQEVRLENDHLIALVRPALGGYLYELDVRQSLTNLLATLEGRPEGAHARCARASSGREPGAPVCAGAVHDRHPRKALVDHFYPLDVTLDDLITGREQECGDFALGTYLARTQRGPRRVAVVMERAGVAAGHSIRLRKTIELHAGRPCLSVRYELDDLPADPCLHFAVEMNVAGTAWRIDECYDAPRSETTIAALDESLDLAHSRGVRLTDLATDIVNLTWSRTAGLWCFPIETMRRYEGGSPALRQSMAVIPHWHITPDERGCWQVLIEWEVEVDSPVATGARRLDRVELEASVRIF